MDFKLVDVERNIVELLVDVNASVLATVSFEIKFELVVLGDSNEVVVIKIPNISSVTASVGVVYMLFVVAIDETFVVLVVDDEMAFFVVVFFISFPVKQCLYVLPLTRQT